MTQLSVLKDEFETALASIKVRLDTPQAPQTSENEAKLEAELQTAHENLSTASQELEKQKADYLALSEEFGELELKLDKVTSDTTLEQAKEDAERRLASLTEESERALSQVTTENATLKIQIAEMEKAATEAQAADMQVGFKSSQSPASEDATDLNEIKRRHATDIEQVQNILKQLKPLVEE